MDDLNRYAAKGTIWVCGACGKVAEDRYGIDRAHSPGWDESCMLNAVLCHYPKGRTWTAVELCEVKKP